MRHHRIDARLHQRSLGALVSDALVHLRAFAYSEQTLVQYEHAWHRFPGLGRVMEAARRGRIDAVLVWKLDRFGRSALVAPFTLRAATPLDRESYPAFRNSS